MAESFIFNTAESVLGQIASFASKEISLARHAKDELRKLESTISTIKAVLLDAEDKQAKNSALGDWLRKLKDAVYDVDDMLDEFQYEALRSKTRSQVSNFFSGSNSLTYRLKMGHRIKAIRTKLDEISAEKSKFHLSERAEDLRVVHRREMTHSFVRASDVIGREQDKERIIELLLMHNGDHSENMSIIPIVGIGGLGKTTLAKLVYNDNRVKEHFEIKMWVCVSEEFDVTKLIKEIISSAGDENVRDTTIDHLQTRLRGTLRGMRFLLILDDVWNEDRRKWVELRDLLLDGSSGSKVVVTTRNPLVASIMGTVSAHNLRGLPHVDCLALFVKWAAQEGQEKQHPGLLRIGNDIVKKCGGVPLAVKTLGSLLYQKTDERDWLFVRDSEIWQLDQRENDILPALRLSYEQLPAYLKQCFAYCSIFPKDYEFRSIELIQLWVAQGLIESANEVQELEKIGDRYIKELWSRSFFQDVEVHDSYTIFKMHDLVHDLALLVARGECLAINSGTQNIISKMVRHVSVCDYDLCGEEFPKLLRNLHKLRTLTFPAKALHSASDSFLYKCISSLKYLRVLDLSYSTFETLPASIGDLKHLRLLSLSKNRRIKGLPESICKLHKLQTLRLDGCWDFERMPEDMWKLVSLRFMFITTKQLLLPRGLWSVKSLEILAIEDCENLVFMHEDIQGLTALRTLIIKDCAEMRYLPRNLKCLTALENLSIINCEMLNMLEREEDIQGLRLNLQVLRILNCPSLLMFPAWLPNLTSLRRLQIRYCPRLLILPEGMNCLTTLKELEIDDCPELIRRCQPVTGEDWPKIAHVPVLTLDYQNMNHLEIS